MSTPAGVQFLNPDTLHKNPAFTNVVVVTGPVKMIYVGGQDAVDSSGNIVGRGDIAAQTEQVLTNIQNALRAAGAELHHVVKWTLLIVQGQDLGPGLQVFRSVWGDVPNQRIIPPRFVPALAEPEFLLERQAIAVVPTPSQAA